jgi:hypothetical protein
MTDLRTCTVVVFALAATSACHESSSGGGLGPAATVHGSGVVVEEARAVSGFTGVTHSSEGWLHVEQAAVAPLGRFGRVTYAADGSLQVEGVTRSLAPVPGEALLVRAEDNLLPYLITEVQWDTLVIRTVANVDLQPTVPIEFFLTVTSLEQVTFQGIGRIDISGLTTDALALTCSGIGEVEVTDLDALELDVVCSGIGALRASGTVDLQTVDLGGLGPYEARDLQSREAHVLVQGADSATLRVSDRLVATIRSSGSVYYIGSPSIEATITGTGTVEQIAR